MKFTLSIPVLPVRDVIRTQDYYRDILGFNIDWRDRDVFGGVSSGEVSLFFQKAEVPPVGFTCVLNTTDADEAYERCVKRGAKIDEPIATQPWGMREFTLVDLNGHRLRIGHVDESAADYREFHRDE